MGVRASGRRALRARLLLACAALASLALVACGEGDETLSPQQPAGIPASKPAQYTATADGKALIGPDNQRISVRPGALTGYVDNVVTDGEVVFLTGWAASADLADPAEHVVGFVGQKGVEQVRGSIKRPDVVEAYDKPALERSGFVLSLTKGSVNCSEPAGGVVVLGIVDGLAGPLTWVAGSDQLLIDEAC